MPQGRTEDCLAETLTTRSKRNQTLWLLAMRMAADERAATAIEYSLMASCIALVIAATVFNFGSTLKETYYDTLAALFP